MSKTTSLLIGLIAFAGQAMAQQPLYKQATAPVEDRVKDLIGRMTVEEKVGQLCCPLGWEMYTKTKNGVVASDLYKERMKAMPIGSFWAVLRRVSARTHGYRNHCFSDFTGAGKYLE